MGATQTRRLESQMANIKVAAEGPRPPHVWNVGDDCRDCGTTHPEKADALRRAARTLDDGTDAGGYIVPPAILAAATD